ncbi:MAG: (2Fe-2S)-binding protein [Vibrionaceae bacterium]|nr:(2Fe-2S)-binding protein [Vibrionaceae bacterium]MBR9876410.1 (2Fe-2S)-binding protein [Vibrionaceae bacterium]
MKTDSKFQRILSSDIHPKTIRFFWEGKEYSACEGDTIAVALLAADVNHTRETPQSCSPRAPFCMMGSCFECRVVVNGEQNIQACMNLIEDGMMISRQRT